MAKPLARMRRRDVSYVRLYLDDLEVLEQTMAKVHPEDERRSFTVEAVGLSCESVAELVENRRGERLSEFKMRVHAGSAYLVIEVSGTRPAYLYVDDENDLGALGAYTAAESVLAKSVLGPAARFLHLLALNGGFVLVMLVLAWTLLILRFEPLDPGKHVIVGLNLVGLVWIAASSWLRFRAQAFAGRVWLDYHRDAPGFFSRNKDVLIVSAIAAILGALLGRLFP